MTKPDKGRLPTYDEFIKEYGKRPADIAFNMAVRLTASIKDAECQKELEKVVEEIIRKIENFATQLVCQGFVDEEYKSFVENRVQSIKQDTLKKVG